MKRLFACILVSLFAASSLAGCGSTPTEKDPSSTAQSSKSSSTAGKDAKPTTITHWEMVNGPADSYPAAAEKIVNDFNANNDQNITVKLQMTPWDNFYQTFLTAVTSGAAPDTSTGAFPQPVQYAVMEEILDLNPVIEQWKQEGSKIPESLPNGSLDMLTYNGILTGIPWATDPRGITYRKDILEKAGVTTLPTTWDEFLETCKAIKENTDTIPFVFGGADQMSTQTMMFFLIQNGAGFTNDKVEADFTNPKVIETLKFMNTLSTNGYISEGTASYKSADAEKMYCSGTAAMWFNGMPAALKDYGDIDQNSSVLPPMKGPSGATAQNYTWVNSIMAYQQTKSPEACRAFIKYWIENELILWTEGKCGQMPARSDVASDDYFTNTWYTKEFNEVVAPTAVPPCWPAANLYPAFSQIEGEDYTGHALQAVITGNTDFEAVAKDANDKIAKALEDYGK